MSLLTDTQSFGSAVPRDRVTHTGHCATAHKLSIRTTHKHAHRRPSAARQCADAVPPRSCAHAPSLTTVQPLPARAALSALEALHQTTAHGAANRALLSVCHSGGPVSRQSHGPPPHRSVRSAHSLPGSVPCAAKQAATEPTAVSPPSPPRRLRDVRPPGAHGDSQSPSARSAAATGASNPAAQPPQPAKPWRRWRQRRLLH